MKIIQVEDIPYTVNMKRVEVPVKKVSCVFILGLARWRWISGWIAGQLERRREGERDNEGAERRLVLRSSTVHR